MHSRGETNWGSMGPPAPNESTKTNCPPCDACVVNALNDQMLFGLALGEGEGDAMPWKIVFWATIENCVPVPLLFKL